MKNISFIQHNTANPILLIISIGFFCMLLFFSKNVLAQKEKDDIAKKILYLSLITDEVSFSSQVLDDVFNQYVIDSEQKYDQFQYKSSGEIIQRFSNTDYTKHDKYIIELYKFILGQNAYYVLRFNSSNTMQLQFKYFEDLWIRVSGFSVSDIKIFFDNLKERGLSSEKLKSIVHSWHEIHPLFKELDWDCILEGYENNDTHRECFISNCLALHKSACINCNDIVTDIYASFSKVILFGSFYPKFD